MLIGHLKSVVFCVSWSFHNEKVSIKADLHWAIFRTIFIKIRNDTCVGEISDCRIEKLRWAINRNGFYVPSDNFVSMISLTSQIAGFLQPHSNSILESRSSSPPSRDKIKPCGDQNNLFAANF